MKILKKYNNKLFATYSIIILTAVLSLTLYFQGIMLEMYKEKSIENIEQVTENMKNNIGIFFGDMDRMAIQLLTNDEVKDSMSVPFSSLSKQEQLHTNMNVENVLMNMISPMFEIRRASVFNEESFHSIGLAEVNYNLVESVRSDVIEDVLKREKNKGPIISDVHYDYWSINGSEVISLFRIMQYGNRNSIIETQRFYDEFLEYVITEPQTTNYFINVVNETRDVLYSSIEDRELNNTEKTILESMYQFDGGESKIKELQSYYYGLVNVEQYGIKFVVAQTNQELLQYYFQQQQYLMFLGVIIVIFLLLASWRLSCQMTKPLTNLKKLMEEITLDNIHDNHEIEYSDLDEMNQVYEVLNHMNERLSDSIDQLVESKKLEIRAQYAALQSQIAPHFIGNTLAIIGAKGYESGAYVVDEMCVILSSMMVYITKQKDSETTIENEMKYAEQYLQLIKYRFEEKFEYGIELEKGLEHVIIPMLIIQPIVENSIIHGFSSDLTCLRIKVRAEYDGLDRWKITIRDNGRGFTKEAIDKFNYLRALYQENQNIFQGFDLTVGLFNAYVRLKMVYGDSTRWEIVSDTNETTIVMGGKIDV